MTQQTKIIIFLIILLAVSSSYLFWVDAKNNSFDYGKDWWAVYFDEPKNLSWNFSIENHSDKNNFKYEIFDGENKISEDSAIIAKGEVRKINLDQKIGGIESKKITITVSDGMETKEIYKNL